MMANVRAERLLKISAEPGLRGAELRIPSAAAQTRVVSTSGIRLGSEESARAFKGVICDDISEFESHMPSHAVGLPQRRCEPRAVPGRAASAYRSYRLGTDEFAEAKNYRGICKIVRRRQILPQQILRHLDAIGNYAIRTHRENARQTLIFSFGNSLVVAALDFNIYQLLA
jgi:hypothetical protein